jgi:telomerase reverse transcriptase
MLPCSIPNVETKYPNKNVQVLKQSPWTDVLALLGDNGVEIMLKLLLDCGLFAAVDVKKGVYCQISGA